MNLAICCYVDNKPAIIEEFRWLYTSWIYSGCPGSLLAFAHPGAVVAASLPGVRVIETIPTTDQEPEWRAYPFINSIGYLATAPDRTFDGFTHILRTDCDCFITPNFPRAAPRLPLFGRGQYVKTPEVSARIGEIAKALGLSYAWCHNVGSTVLSTVSSVRHYDGKQKDICGHLLREGFKDGRGKWPGWWWGTLTMYAGELAANAIWGVGITVCGLDCMSMSSDPLGALDFHIHAWTSDQNFSETHFRAGKYDSIPLATLRPDTVQNYCLYMAKTAAVGGKA